MSLRLEIRKKMVERSPRVKAMDFHPELSWVMLGLYSGTIALHDYSTNTCIRALQCSVYPVRAVRFIPAKQWMVAGSDDLMVRVYNYNTMEKIKEFQAHQDFLRAIIVHPLQSYMITCSDDTKIKIWDYNKDFNLVRTLEEHKHFVLTLGFNPRDLTKFASGSMDKSIKIWNLTTEGKANLTLNGHKSGVNCLDFYKGDKPHLVSGSDDRTIKVWDYQTKQCITSIQAYKSMVTSVAFHPQLPILLSTGQQGKALIHHSNSYTLLNTLEYNLERCWVVDVSKQNTNVIAFGYDEGTVVIKIGSDQPVVSLSNGKILWTKSMEIYGTNLKAVNLAQNPSGEKVKLQTKQHGSIDLYPIYIKHSPNGHHFAICNQKQFSVFKLASFKSVILGNGTNLVWENDSDFAVLENDMVNIYHNFEYSSAIKVPFAPHKIFEGPLLTVAGQEKVLFYAWDDITQPVNQLPLNAKKIWWNENGQFLSICTAQKTIIYLFNKSNNGLTQLISIVDKVTSGCWVGKIFFYMNAAGKIFYSFHMKNFFYSNCQKKQFILGAIEQQNRLYLFDRNNNLYSINIQFAIYKAVVAYIQGKTTELPDIPSEMRDRVAKCLHAFDLLKPAYKIVESQDHKFQLALQLNLIRQAYGIAMSTHSSEKIKMIGDIALRKGQIELAISCFEQINDLNSLLLIYSTLSLPEKLAELGDRAQTMTKMNIAYMCYYLTNNPEKCIDVLIKSKRFSQAALFSRTYCSKRVSECVRLWKESLTDKTIADKISDPNEEEQQQEGQQGQQGDDGEKGQDGQEDNQDGEED